MIDLTQAARADRAFRKGGQDMIARAGRASGSLMTGCGTRWLVGRGQLTPFFAGHGAWAGQLSPAAAG